MASHALRLVCSLAALLLVSAAPADAKKPCRKNCPPEPPPTESDCDDGIDNDGDGYTDALDLGCLEDREDAATGCNPLPDPANLIPNGHLECGAGGAEPSGWARFGAAPAELAWGEAGAALAPWTSKIFTAQSAVAGSYTSRWELVDPATGATLRIPLQPETWYAFSVALGADGIDAYVDPAQQDQMHRNSFWNGATLDIRSAQTDVRYEQVSLHVGGPAMTDFDEQAGVYRDVAVAGAEPLQRLVRYFRTAAWSEGEEGLVAELATVQYSSGSVYFDDFELRELGAGGDPSVPAAPSKGDLLFTQRDGAPFFPIVLWGDPRRNGTPVRPTDPDWDAVVGAGFNAHGYWAIGQTGQDPVLNAWPDGLGIVFPLENPYWLSGSTVFWRRDPERLLPFSAPARNQELFDRLQTPENAVARQNLLYALAIDEANCHPAEWGSPRAQTEVLGFARDQLKTAFPELPLVENLCPENYSGVSDDLAFYLPRLDVLMQTANLPSAYPGGIGRRKMSLDLVAGRLRRSLAIAESSQRPVPGLAFALGVREWSHWDGSIGASPYPVVPFNLQRYLVFSQLVNGATGVWFWLSSSMDLADPADAYHFQQMRHLAEELAALAPVLEVPEFSRASVSDPRIETMLKKHEGKQYVIAVSNAPVDIHGVTITVGRRAGRVTALAEVVDGDLAGASDRLVCEGDCKSFVDDFLGESAASPQGVATPGYSVHVYEITR